ncbi:MAG: hypothetical protein R3F30_09945 [Planctomycetota bacterium]
MEGLLKEFGDKVAERPGRMRLRVAIGGSKPQSWQVEEYRELERSFVVKHGKETGSIPLAELEASAFAEACFRYKLAEKDEQKQALGLAIALELPTIQDEKDLRAVEKLVDKEGLPKQFAFLKDLEPMALAAAVLRKARTEAKITRDGDALLEQLSKSLGGMPRSSQLEWMVRNDLPGILDDVFLKSASWADRLKGKVTISGDRARIEYDWSSPSQAMDWLLVDVAKEPFGMPEDLYGTPQKPERPTEVKVDTQAKELRIFGDGFLRHRLQFEGDVAVEFRWVMDKEETAEGTRASPTRCWVLLDALRPSTFLGLDLLPGRTNPGLKAVLDGKSRSKSNFKQDSFNKAIRAGLSDKPLRFERKGDRAYLYADGEELLSCKADKLPDMGAVVLASLHSATLADGKQANLRVGKVVVEGRPCDESLASSKAGFLRKWANRFPGLQ